MTTEPYGENGALLRTYRYSASLAEIPSNDTVSGTVKLTDPWEPSLVYRLPVYIHQVQNVVVTPSMLALNLQSSTDTETVATFLVKRKSASDAIHIQEASSSKPVFEICDSELNATGRVTVVSVRLAANQSVATGVRELVIHTDSNHRRTMPVRVNVRPSR